MKTVVLFIVRILAKAEILTPIRVARLKFLYKMHRWPDFERPKDVNEKINWMKFYGDTSLWSMLADKYAVRKYVADRVGEEYLIPLLGKWDSVDEIDWDSLPQQFVMKCNNGSGDVVVCKDKRKLDIEATKKHFKKCLREKFSVLNGEPHYGKIKPCIIAEELLDASTQPCNSSSLVDYKIWVFGGKPMYNWCTWNREQYHANVALYDMEWNFHPEWCVWTSHYVKPDVKVPKPKCFDRLMEIAGKLGNGHPMIRVDMYIVDDEIYFGEMTLTPFGGYMDNFSQKFLDKMGELTILPIDKQ